MPQKGKVMNITMTGWYSWMFLRSRDVKRQLRHMALLDLAMHLTHHDSPFILTLSGVIFNYLAFVNQKGEVYVAHASGKKIE